MNSDFRYALRMLRRNPGFTLVAVLALSLGIGLNAAIFSVANAVLLRPLPYADPGKLVMIWENDFVRKHERNVVAPADYFDWKAAASSFVEMVPVLDENADLTGSGEPTQLNSEIVGAGFFPMLGVPPLRGRTFTTEEDHPGAARVAVLSYQTWSRQFSSDPKIPGRSITLDGAPATVIGVMPPGFQPLLRRTDVWLTAPLDPARNYRVRAGRFMRVAARLKPGIGIQQAQTELSMIAKRLELEYPKFNKGWGVTVVSMQEQFSGSSRKTLLILLGAVSLVLLIACANVANLLLARATTRRKEIAVRASIGAGRRRIIQQLLTESLVLAAISGTLGIALAFWVMSLIRIFGPRNIPRLQTVALDPAVLAFTAALTLITGVLFGLAPAIGAASLNLSTALKDAGRSSSAGLRGRSFRSLLVAGEIATSVVLLICAGLMIESLVRLQSVNPGFNPDHLLTMSVSLPSVKYPQPAARVAFFEEAVARIARLPGVESASATAFLPFNGMAPGTGVKVVGRPEPLPGQTPVTDARVVHRDYFRTMQIPLKRGRMFTEADSRPGSPRTFLISESMARRLFPNEDPLGKRLIVQMGDDIPGEIIGIVGDVKHYSLDAEAPPMTYYPHAHLPFPFMTFVIRAKKDPMKLAAPAIREIRQMNPEQIVTDVQTMDTLLGESVSRSRFTTVLLGIFSALALALASIGVYGVMSYAVAQNTRDFGIRIALGARRGNILGLVIRHGALLAAFGILVGLPAAFAAARLLGSFLFEVKPGHPVTYAIVAAILAAMALLASYIPARRAVRVDPAITLRDE